MDRRSLQILAPAFQPEIITVREPHNCVWGGCKGHPVTSKGCEFSVQDPGAHMTNGDEKHVAVRSITGNFKNLLFRSFKRLFKALLVCKNMY